MVYGGSPAFHPGVPWAGLCGEGGACRDDRWTEAGEGHPLMALRSAAAARLPRLRDSNVGW